MRRGKGGRLKLGEKGEMKKAKKKYMYFYLFIFMATYFQM